MDLARETAATQAAYGVGVEPTDEYARQCLLARRCLEAATEQMRIGNHLGDIGHAIQSLAESRGYGVVRDFTGHGIGEAFHSGLYVPHYDSPELEVVMEPGMTFTVEPMITLGTHEHDMWADGWTAVTKDRRWTAQFEHTILVTDSGAEILTLP